VIFVRDFPFWESWVCGGDLVHHRGHRGAQGNCGLGWGFLLWEWSGVDGSIGLGIDGGPRLHGPTFAQGNFSVKVVRHIEKLKLWKSLEHRTRGSVCHRFFCLAG